MDISCTDFSIWVFPFLCFKIEFFFRFDPPVIPKDFLPHHKFPGPLEFDKKPATLSPPPPEVPPPEDDNSKVLIEGVATLVARCGKLFEDLSREKNQSNPLFSFLTGGNGHDYYSRKLWEEQQKRNGQKKIALDGKLSSSVDKMTVESRGKILGEMPLERSSRDLSSSIASVNVNLPFNLSDTFTKPESFVSGLISSAFAFLFSNSHTFYSNKVSCKHKLVNSYFFGSILCFDEVGYFYN